MNKESHGKRVGCGAAYPAELAEAERELIAKRRKACGSSSDSVAGARDVGLALSGGGIRSATFCLGVIQAMARADVLRKVDYLSTVSGGGYAGSFLGTLFARSGGSQDRAKEVLANSRSAELYWLRENGRYLSPNGSGDSVTSAGVYLRNLASVHIVMGLALLACFLLLHTLRFATIDLLPEGGDFAAFFKREPGGIWWSPLIVLAPAILVFVAAPLAWVYWLVQDRITLRSSLSLIATLLAIATGAALAFSGGPGVIRVVGGGVAGVAGLAVFFWIGLTIWLLKKSDEKEVPIESRQRSLVSRWFGKALVLSVGAAGLALVDSIAQTLYAAIREGDGNLLGFGLSAASPFAIMAALKRFAVNFDEPREGEKKRLQIGMLVTPLALVLAFVGLVVWCLGSHAIARGFEKEIDGPAAWWAAYFGFLLTATLAWVLSHSLRFINLSSNQQLYASRLARAYLGATNPERRKAENANVSTVIKGDDLSMEEYHPEETGGPLHLVNVTINETVSGRSQIEQRDRKGLPMCVGPSGMSAGRRSHALWAAGRASEEEHKRDDGSPPPIEYTNIRPIKIGAGEGREFHILGKWVMGKPPGEESQKVEKLSLRHWISISGAAFSTGTGANTSLGLSLLLGIANVRLGYWWDSTILPGERDPLCEEEKKKEDVRTRSCVSARIGQWMSDWALPVHMHLLDEFLARFHGPARQRWYLSDGGHFENTACYELIRRRVPFIICCDDGADPDYRFQDVGNLVRKARIDFRAEFHFLEEDELSELLDPELLEVIGGCHDLVRYSEEECGDGLPGKKHRKRRYSRKHAFLARVDYEEEQGDGIVEQSYILFLKPSLTGDEPSDVIEYHGRCGAFPQEPTSDQFFDEAQWESYRKLGEHIGEKIFARSDGDKWRPSRMQPPPGDCGDETLSDAEKLRR